MRNLSRSDQKTVDELSEKYSTKVLHASERLQRGDEVLPNKPDGESGYVWLYKRDVYYLFIPSRTKLRLTCAAGTHMCTCIDGLFVDEHNSPFDSPNSWASSTKGGSLNCWDDIELLFPAENAFWMKAGLLRSDSIKRKRRSKKRA